MLTQKVYIVQTVKSYILNTKYTQKYTICKTTNYKLVEITEWSPMSLLISSMFRTPAVWHCPWRPNQTQPATVLMNT